MNQKPELEVITPEWDAPDNVRAMFTLRSGGLSAGPYGAADGFNGLNLGSHVGDSPYCVKANRRLLTEKLGAEPVWLRQVHSVRAVKASEILSPDTTEADAVYTSDVNIPCGVLTADCVPVLFCDDQGRAVGAAHAGWKGLVNGVLQATVNAMRAEIGNPEARILALIGPHIRPENFQIHSDVADCYLSSELRNAAGDGLVRTGEDTYLLNLACFCREALSLVGVRDVYDCGLDTFTDESRFYSYRRSGVTGRHGAFICKIF